jgi:intracellular septation protein
MAVLNEIIWRTQSTDFWVAFKAFGVLPITAVFAMLQMSLINRHSVAPATAETSDVKRGDV